MAAIRLVAIDLDGTLLDPEEHISSANRAAVAAARAAGAEVVLVTARGFQRAQPYARELGLALPLLCCGGALVADSASGRVLVHRPLPPADALPILAYALEQRLLLLVHYDGAYLAHPATIAAYPDMADLVLPPWRPCEDLAGPIRTGATFLRALGQPSVRALRRRFEAAGQGRLRFVELAWRGLTDLGIYDAAASKGQTLRAFCAERGLRPEEVMAIGDHASDRSMFEAAGLRVAMANADAELKALADFVTGSNAEDGVAHALHRFVAPLPRRPRQN